MQKIFLGCTLHWQQLQFLHALHRGVSPLRAQPAPTPGASTQSAPRTQPATRRRPVPATAPAPSTGTPAHSTTRAHSQHPAPCFHHAHSQLTAPSTSTQHPQPVGTTRTASSQAPSTGTLSPPRAQQGITTYGLARKRLCAQKHARKQQSP